jgi:S-adenosylmethionine-diacylgycerolhomoserine-N-methlytransferase
MSGEAAAAMDRMYRGQRHIYDLTRKYYLLGRDRVITDLGAMPSDRVLEIGCGTGRNLILAAQKFPSTQFFGIDVSNEMLTTAREAIARAGLADRVRVAAADATSFDPQALFGVASFDRIFISYTLSMIPDWTAVLDQAVAKLVRGGTLQIVDFGGQEGWPHWFRVGLRRWLKLFHVRPRDRLEARLSDLCALTGATLQMERPVRGYAQHATMTLAA